MNALLLMKVVMINAANNPYGGLTFWDTALLVLLVDALRPPLDPNKPYGLEELCALTRTTEVQNTRERKHMGCSARNCKATFEHRFDRLCPLIMIAKHQ